MRTPPRIKIIRKPPTPKKSPFSYSSVFDALSLAGKWVTTQAEALRNGPTIWTVTPFECTVKVKEQLKERITEREIDDALRQGSHVKFDFYLNIDQIRKEKAPSSTLYMPWTISGNVDLTPMLQIYGITSLQVIDPMRWIEFTPARPNMLSGMAVETLRLKDSSRGIIITESPVPFVTRVLRSVRIAYLLCYFYAYSLFHLVAHGGLERKDVPVLLGNCYWSIYCVAKRGRVMGVATKHFIVENWGNVILSLLVLYVFCWSF